MAEAELTTVRPARRVLGAALGAALSGLVALVEIIVFVDAFGWGFLVADRIGITGIPVAAILGWRFAGRVDRWTATWLAAWMAVAAVLLGRVLSVTLLAASEVAEGSWPLIWLPQVYVMGLVWFGWQLLPFTLPAAIAWVGLMRLVLRWLPQRNSPGIQGRGWVVSSGAGEIG